jgi:hypothetical protein
MNTIDKLLVLSYNLTLLAGASFLVYYKDASAWIFALALVFGASWREKKDDDKL